ncbi:MAG: Holliday junction branch migration protein RuvA [Vampirovibrionales bacterium]|nr:Holliday junction branch migration protein RuvA [Vampirovibrionales bacterium]
MINQLTGTLLHVGTSPFKGPYVVCNLNGMGLECLVLQRSLPSLQASLNQETTLFTVLIVREDLLQLVGFVTPTERDLFALLQQASGVGLRTALALMDALSVSELASAIVANESKPLTVAKGVGPKLAQKIVLELKEKIATFQQSVALLGDSTAMPLPAHTLPADVASEAEAVLLSLGYHPQEIAQGLRAIHGAGTGETLDKKLTAEWVLQKALQWLATHV